MLTFSAKKAQHFAHNFRGFLGPRLKTLYGQHIYNSVRNKRMEDARQYSQMEPLFLGMWIYESTDSV